MTSSQLITSAKTLFPVMPHLRSWVRHHTGLGTHQPAAHLSIRLGQCARGLAWAVGRAMLPLMGSSHLGGQPHSTRTRAEPGPPSPARCFTQDHPSYLQGCASPARLAPQSCPVRSVRLSHQLLLSQRAQGHLSAPLLLKSVLTALPLSPQALGRATSSTWLGHGFAFWHRATSGSVASHWTAGPVPCGGISPLARTACGRAACAGGPPEPPRPVLDGARPPAWLRACSSALPWKTQKQL